MNGPEAHYLLQLLCPAERQSPSFEERDSPGIKTEDADSSTLKRSVVPIHIVRAGVKGIAAIVEAWVTEGVALGMEVRVTPVGVTSEVKLRAASATATCVAGVASHPVATGVVVPRQVP